jgi:hypothetical protein
MNNEEDNADGIAFANAADFQDKVQKHIELSFVSFIRHYSKFFLEFFYYYNVARIC